MVRLFAAWEIQLRHSTRVTTLLQSPMASTLSLSEFVPMERL